MYIDTSGKLARDAKTSVPTVVLYAKRGWLDYIVASNGTRLFRAGQADRVRELLAQQMARIGRPRKAG